MKIKLPYWYLLAIPFAMYYFGDLLNIIAVTVNHGMMPYIAPAVEWQIANAQGQGLYPGAIVDEIHQVMTSANHLKFLCDWIQLPRVGTASPGDFFIWIGDMLKLPGVVAYVMSVWHNPTS